MNGDPHADAALLRRAAAGEARASRELVTRHLGAVVAFAHRMLGERAAAEDVAQETFLRMWDQASRWEPRARLRTWLLRVAHNLCIDRLRRRREVGLTEAADIADPAPDPLNARHQRQVAASVTAALAKLPARQRAAIALVHFDELSANEAAAIMEISIEALESLLARARRRLHALLLAERDHLIGQE
jgi:RNA polymerase sigma-70 factor (ECF subfamily)